MSNAQKVSLKISKDELVKIAHEQKMRQEAAMFGWKKIGNLAYEYIYADRKTFGEKENQASAEILGRLMAAAWPDRYEITEDAQRYRLLPGNEKASVSEVAELYNQYREVLEVEDEKPTKRAAK